MSKRKRHWMMDIVDSLRERKDEAVEAVAAGIVGDAPFAFVPPKPNDEIKAFLNMDPVQRQQLFTQMGPEQYQQWSTSMMGKLNTRFGAAAELLFPMLQGAPIESLSKGVTYDDGTAGIAAAQAELTDLLGFDPLA